MRLTPMPLAYARSPAEAIERSGESSRTTHRATAAVDACRYLGSLIVGALQGSKVELLVHRYGPISGYWDAHLLAPEIAEVAAGSFRHRHRPEMRGTAYVVHTLEAAVWAFEQSESFREGCLLAVNFGDDADTSAAVYGQLDGAFYGEPEIPETWRQTGASRVDRSVCRSTLPTFLYAITRREGGRASEPTPASTERGGS